MEDRQDARRAKYHHGDLRRALVEAGLDLVREEGVDSLTLRAVARRAGVSHAAPQHHFADKATLVEALALEGFTRFGLVLRDAWTGTSGDSLQRLAEIGRAYVQFAQEEENVFRLMMRTELRGGGGWESPVGEAARVAYRALEGGIRACQKDGIVREGDPGPWALLAWSGVHGLTMLILDKLLEHPVETIEEGNQAADAVLMAMGMGLFHSLEE